MIKTDYKKYPGVQKVPAGACKHYWKCENMTPAGNESPNELCDECLDEVRDNGRGYDK